MNRRRRQLTLLNQSRRRLRLATSRRARVQATNDGPKDKEEPVVFFDFDSYTLRSEAHPVLQSVAEKLRGQNTEKVRDRRELR